MKVEAIPGSVVLSNIGETYGGFYTIESPYMPALGFSTGPGAYQINRLSLSLLAANAEIVPSVNFSVRLYAAGADGLPTGAPLALDDNLTATWTPPFATGDDQRTFNYGSAQLPNLSAYNLSPNTKYALGVITTSGTFSFYWAMGSSAYTTSEGFAFTTGSFFDDISSSWSVISDKPIAAISVAANPCGPGLALPVNPDARWQQLALPCVPTADPALVGTVLGANTTGQLDATIYGKASDNGWLMYGNDLVNNTNRKLEKTDTLTNGIGYWIKSFAAPVGDGNLEVTGTATPVTTGDGCASANGCKAIAVTTVSGADRFNLVGNPFPYNVDWAQVRVRVKNSGGTTIGTYTPSQAAGVATGDDAAGDANPAVMSNTIWIYSGTQYESWSDVSLPNPGNLKYFQSFWVKVYAAVAANGYTVELLIPAEQSTHGQLAPAGDTRLAETNLPWYLAWLDRLIAPAAADEPEDFGTAQHPGTHSAEYPTRPFPQLAAPAAANSGSRPKTQVRLNAQGLDPSREWYVSLRVDEPATGYKDHNSVIGQLLTAQNGYDPRDLVELAPFGKPFMTLVFPHPEWGPKAGDYASDFRSAQKLNARGRSVPGLPAADWTFQIRADRPDTPVILRWEGPPAVLNRSQLIDPTVRKPIKLKDYPDGYPVTLTNGNRTLTWRYLGQVGLLR